MSKIQTFDFNGNDVRVVDVNGEVWFVARDVGRVLGLKQQAISEITKKLPDVFKGTISIGTPGGKQNVTIISYEAVNKMVLRSRKKEAEPFQDWVSFEVLPCIRNTGHYVAGPKTEAEKLEAFTAALHRSAQQAVAQERRLENHEVRIQAIEDRMEEDDQSLLDVERSSDEPLDKSTRAKINTIVRVYCVKKKWKYSDGWRKLYAEFRDRYHIDIPTRAANRDMKKLDLAEEEGWMDELYALASAIFV